MRTHQQPSYIRYALTVVLCSLATMASAVGTFDLVSIGNDGSLASSYYNGDHSAITPDGRYVVFRSGETKFVTPNTSGYQIFLRDRVLGTTELVSRNDQGVYGNSSSDWPSISNDGCRVVYESYASNLVSGDSNGTTDVFMLDRCGAQPSTTLVSRNSSGVQANGQSKSADISGDGNVVVFWSYATNLGAAEQSQIYMRNLTTETTELVSRKQADFSKGGNYGSDCPAVSDDGSRVAFWSYASDLVAGDGNGLWDIFLYDAGTGSMQVVSADSNGVQQNQGGEGISSVTCPAISGDGNYVAFASRATSLVASDTNGFSDIFVKDTVGGTLQRASVSSSGIQGDAASSGRPGLSLDGSWVVFNSSATNLATETAGVYPNIVAHNVQTGETIGFAGAASSDYPAISGDLHGQFISAFWGGKLSAYNSAGVFTYNRNQRPIANAGPDQSLTAIQTITLDGTGSYDPDDFIANALNDPSKGFTWSQLEGPEVVSFSNPHAKQPTFTPSQEGIYRFQLVVNDGFEDSVPDQVVIQIDSTGSSTTNLPPIADAGSDQLVDLGTVVNLDGSLSNDPEGHNLSYTWSQLFGPEAVSFSSVGSETPSFTPGQVGTYIFQLVVNDGTQDSDPSFVSVDVSPILVDAGQDRPSNIGQVVKLISPNAQILDPTVNKKKLKYYWEQLSGPTVNLKGKVGARARNFIPTLAGSYQFGLRATDGVYASTQATVTITVNPSIQVTEPSVATVWTVGSVATINWSIQDINPKQNLVIVYSLDGGNTAKFLKRGVKAGKGSYSFKVKPGLVSDQAMVDVCLWPTAKNDLVCGDTQATFLIQ